MQRRFSQVMRAALAGVMLTLVGASLGAQQGKQSDWAQFRGPNGAGASADKGLPLTWTPNNNVVWKAPLPGPGYSSPVVFGKRIYLTCYTGYNVPGQRGGDQKNLELQLLCLDRDSGKAVWTKKVMPKLPEQERIREEHGYASSTPAVDADRVYVFFGKSGVFAFDHDGNQKWQADVGSKLNDWGSAASPVLLGDLVLVNASVESQTLFALDKNTGKEKWRAPGIRESWNTPIVVDPGSGKKEIVLAIMGKVLGFDPATGRQLWSCATDIPWYMVPTLLTDGGVVYAIGGRNPGGALAVKAGGSGDVTKTHRLWSIRKGSNVTSPVLHGGHLYWMGDSNGIAYCVDIKNGNTVYEERLPRPDQVYASAVLADGKLYYMGRGGRCFVMPAQPKFEILATNQIEERGRFDATPAVAGGKIYVRSNRFLYCLGAK